MQEYSYRTEALSLKGPVLKALSFSRTGYDFGSERCIAASCVRH